jgi:hypothetical protein
VRSLRGWKRSQPRDFDGQVADAADARLADAAFTARFAAGIGRWSEASEGSHLSAVAQMAPGKELMDEGARGVGADAAQRQMSACARWS